MSPLLTVPSKERNYSLEELHPYQLDAVEFIKTTPACALWFRMGGGKTVSVLTALWDLYNNFKIHKVLVIAPLRVAKDVWPKEIQKCDHLKGLSYLTSVSPLLMTRLLGSMSRFTTSLSWSSLTICTWSISLYNPMKNNHIEEIQGVPAIVLTVLGHLTERAYPFLSL